jgi:hypothetical protein
MLNGTKIEIDEPCSNTIEARAKNYVDLLTTRKHRTGLSGYLNCTHFSSAVSFITNCPSAALVV